METSGGKRKIDLRSLREARVRPVRLQVATLCYRRTKSGRLRILLVTSRETRRWIIPKGWTATRLPADQAAAIEAWEEAGVRGVLLVPSIGFFSYHKVLGRDRVVRCTVQTFLMRVETQEKRFPESGERKVRWFGPRQAAKRVQEPALRRMILDFAATQKRAASR
jgi:8-oxo-dGTP pyrophosphatase MutT (NUDIX family)